MTGSSTPVAPAGDAGPIRASARTEREIADRLHRELGVPVGLVDPDLPAWRVWAPEEDDPPRHSPPSSPAIDHARVGCFPGDTPSDSLWLCVPVPRPGSSRPWIGLARFDEATAPWSEAAIVAWGESLARTLAIEATARTGHERARASDVADNLLRRLRVSDPPEKFQRRALAVVRDALDVEAVAWISKDDRDRVLMAGSIPGIAIETFRELAHERADVALRICNHSTPDAPIRRSMVVADPEAGWLLAANPVPDRPFASEAQLLSTVTSLIATQRSNARIYGDLKDLLFGVIRALTAAIDAKDPYTSGHSERVARIAVRIGRELGISPHDQGDLYLMGLLHDVGKIGVEDRVLKKPGKLTPEEYAQIQSHVRIGVHILADLKKLHHLLPGVAYHHESLDGTGYPSGLSGEAIPLAARILAVADAFDAMSSSRPYRRRMMPSEIDEVLRKGMGSQWDARVVNALIACREDLDRIRQKGLGESLQHAINDTLGRA